MKQMSRAREMNRFTRVRTTCSLISSISGQKGGHFFMFIEPWE